MESTEQHNGQDNAAFAGASLGDLKLVYRILHRHLADDPALLDCQYVLDLQSFLHTRAWSDGVDTTDHTAWDDWLNRTGDRNRE